MNLSFHKLNLKQTSFLSRRRSCQNDKHMVDMWLEEQPPKSEYRLLQQDWGGQQVTTRGICGAYPSGCTLLPSLTPPSQHLFFENQKSLHISVVRTFFVVFDCQNKDSPDRTHNSIRHPPPFSYQKAAVHLSLAGRGSKVAQKVMQKQESTATSIFHHLIRLHLLQQETAEQSSDRVISTSFLRKKVC